MRCMSYLNFGGERDSNCLKVLEKPHKHTAQKTVIMLDYLYISWSLMYFILKTVTLKFRSCASSVEFKLTFFANQVSVCSIEVRLRSRFVERKKQFIG